MVYTLGIVAYFFLSLIFINRHEEGKDRIVIPVWFFLIFFPLYFPVATNISEKFVDELQKNEPQIKTFLEEKETGLYDFSFHKDISHYNLTQWNPSLMGDILYYDSKYIMIGKTPTLLEDYVRFQYTPNIFVFFGPSLSVNKLKLMNNEMVYTECGANFWEGKNTDRIIVLNKHCFIHLACFFVVLILWCITLCPSDLKKLSFIVYCGIFITMIIFYYSLIGTSYFRYITENRIAFILSSNLLAYMALFSLGKMISQAKGKINDYLQSVECTGHA